MLGEGFGDCAGAAGVVEEFEGGGGAGGGGEGGEEGEGGLQGGDEVGEGFCVFGVIVWGFSAGGCVSWGWKLKETGENGGWRGGRFFCTEGRTRLVHSLEEGFIFLCKVRHVDYVYNK